MIRSIIPTETQEMIAYMDWAKYVEITIRIGERFCNINNEEIETPIYEKRMLTDFIIHIPNEGKRTAKGHWIQKRIGLKKGASDLFIMIPSPPYHGLFIEMKRNNRKSEVSIYQEAFIDEVSTVGYEGVIAYGAKDAITQTIIYLSNLKQGASHVYASYAKSAESKVTF